MDSRSRSQSGYSYPPRYESPRVPRRCHRHGLSAWRTERQRAREAPRHWRGHAAQHWLRLREPPHAAPRLVQLEPRQHACLLPGLPPVRSAAGVLHMREHSRHEPSDRYLSAGKRAKMTARSLAGAQDGDFVRRWRPPSRPKTAPTSESVDGWAALVCGNARKSSGTAHWSTRN